MSGHTCHWPGCEVEVPAAMWGCKPHWFALPKHLRDRIWQTYRRGQEVSKDPSPEYIAAAHAVQAWIAEYRAGSGAKGIEKPLPPLADTPAPLLDELPARPPHWRMRMTLHLNYGGGKGGGVYSVYDENGLLTPIVYQYDTRQAKPPGPRGGKGVEPAPTGFHVPRADTEVFPNWTALCSAWPGIVKKLREAGPC